MKTKLFLPLLVFGLAITSNAAQTPAVLVNALLEADRSAQIVERGQDFAIFRNVTTTTNSDGSSSFQTNHFTLLENCLHYEENGQWKLSEDIVEPFPTGAIARRGPNKAIFSSDLHSESVFDIQMATGQRIRGGVRSIQFTDINSGRTVVLGTVKPAAPGIVVAPNQVVYKSAFDGIDADVLFVWRHNSISQNVILNQKPILPANMDPATTRIEVITELVESPQPVLSTVVPRKPRNPDIRDEMTIGFGSMQAVRGKAYAFPLAGVDAVDALLVTGDDVSSGHSGVCVVKQLHELPDGRRFVIESVGWQEAEPLMTRMVAAKDIGVLGDGETQLAASRVWPKRIATVARQQPMQVTAEKYKSDGFLVDIDLSGVAGSYTFLSGTTYYIAQSFFITSGGGATFQPGSVVKYGNNANLLVGYVGPISCPPVGQLMPVLTSKDDDLFGAIISGSTGNPTQMAYPAVHVYYTQNVSTEIKNIRIRWAKRGIEYSGTGDGFTHYVRDSLFQQCQVGIYVDLLSGYLILENVRMCSVSTLPMVISGTVSGVAAQDCGPFYTVATFPGIKQEEDPLVPADIMGAVGPNHFMVVLNGAVAVYNKYTGARLSPTPPTSLNSFLSVTVPPGDYAGTYPTATIFDPRVVYDHEHQRWFACAVDGRLGSQHVVLGVSNGPDPVGSGGPTWVADNWKKYLVPVGPCAGHYPTLGLDSNGIYICVQQTGSGCLRVRIVAIPKVLWLIKLLSLCKGITSSMYPFTAFPSCSPRLITILLQPRSQPGSFKDSTNSFIIIA